MVMAKVVCGEALSFVFVITVQHKNMENFQHFCLHIKTLFSDFISWCLFCLLYFLHVHCTCYRILLRLFLLDIYF